LDILDSTDWFRGQGLFFSAFDATAISFGGIDRFGMSVPISFNGLRRDYSGR
jgi:hypothetical protein